MKKIYKFENAKATVEENGTITVVVNEIYQPEDGEIVMFQDRPDSVFVYRKVDNINAKATTYYVALCAGIQLYYNDPEHHMLRGFDFTDVVPATEEAKQLLFDALESRNLMWDPETKTVARWRASLGCIYYFITDYGEVCASDDFKWEVDNNRFKFGNYFATYELAEKAMKNFKNSLTL